MFLRVLSCALCLPTAAVAQDVTFKLKPGTVDRLSLVMAHDARHVALSDAHGWLAFAHDQKHADAHVSLVKLDDKGNPAAKNIALQLPCPTGLGKKGNYALSVAFHPKLPLLYVWQEANWNYFLQATKPAPKDVWELDHLLIYDVSTDPPKLLRSLCRGQEYLFGLQGGQVAVDPEGAFLYIPNLRDPTNIVWWKVGRYPLDKEGMPQGADKGPVEKTPPDHVSLFAANQHGVGTSIVPLSRDIALLGGVKGVMGWRPEDKAALVNAVPIKYQNPALVAAHPALPAVYAVRMQTDSMFRLDQTDGFLSLIPRQWTFPGKKLMSAPVFLPKTNQLVVGGQHFLYLLDLDDAGDAKVDAVEMQVFNDAVRALIYSPRFDRLYASVDLSK